MPKGGIKKIWGNWKKKLFNVTLIILIFNSNLFSQFSIIATPFTSRGYTLEAVRLRAQPSTTSNILKVIPGFTDFEITEQLHEEKIGNDTDHWYKVRLFDDSGAVGYLFGNFLSTRQKGRQLVTLKFKEVQFGDYSHYFFLDAETGKIDEYKTEYISDNFNLLNENGDDINPIYKNRLFRALINRLPGLVPVGPEEMGPGEVNIIIELVTIN